MRLSNLTLALLMLCGCSDSRWTPETPDTPSPPAIEVTVTFDASGGAARSVTGPFRGTTEERQVGLMHRKERLGPAEGMLFAMDEDRDHSFWMENTWIPLDMVFIDKTGVVVGILRDVPPRTRDSRTVGKTSRFVLEVDAGWCARNGLRVGERADFRFSPAPPSASH